MPFSFDLGLKFEDKKNSVFLKDWVKKWGLGPKAAGAKYWTKKMTNVIFLLSWVLTIDFVRKYIKFLKITIFEDYNLNLSYLIAMFTKLITFCKSHQFVKLGFEINLMNFWIDKKVTNIALLWFKCTIVCKQYFYWIFHRFLLSLCLDSFLFPFQLLGKV